MSVKLLLLSGDKSINLNDEIVLSDSTKFESIMFGQSDKMVSQHHTPLHDNHTPCMITTPPT